MEENSAIIIPMPKSYFIKTYGCQQNVNDSEILAGILESMGYSEAQNPEDADIILVNTCTVRQRAENKAYGFIGGLKKLKSGDERREMRDEKKSHLTPHTSRLIGVCGCLPQQERANLLQKFPFVDFILGPANVHELREILDGARPKSITLTETCNPENRNLPQKRAQDVTAYISIMYGCNNFCSFCIVPYVRGREVSRPEKDILNEIKGLDKNIFKEVVLLGQNVNSYRGQGLGARDQGKGLAGLLKEVHEIKGLERIRFLTSHPRDMSDNIIQAVEGLPKVCEFFHLPLQSGDDQVLKNMNRGYTADYYCSLIDKIRKEIPDAAITSDVVVGFPGETEEQFEHTLYMIRDVRFDAVNTAAYSLRPKTKAAKLPGHLPDDVKRARLNKVMKVVEETAWNVNQKLVGKTVEVLVDKSGIGRTRGNKVVKFDGGNSLAGQLVHVKIVEAKSWVITGSLNPKY